jgi:pimeloyl-ACP methyl ester carboxylesterase
VIEVAHSFGSITSLLEAATYHDAAGVILTSAGHSQSSFATHAEPDLYPAIDDPMFADSGLDPGYLTTVPGTRGTLFYHLPDADPAVITADEATKSTVSAAEFATGPPLQTSAITDQITAPVLIIDGQDDQIICGAQAGGGTYDCSSGTAIAQQEAPFYAPAVQLHSCVVPGSGHVISLALNHVVQEADAVTWSLGYVGQLDRAAPPEPVLPPDCS